jgi:hypothetical protein
MWRNGDDLNTLWLQQLTVPPVNCCRRRQPLLIVAPVDRRLCPHVLLSSRPVVALRRPLPLTAEPLRHRQDCAKELWGVHGVFPPPRGCCLVIDVGRWAPSFLSRRKGNALMDVVLSLSEQLRLTPPLPSFLLPFPFGSEQRQTSKLAVKLMINVRADVVNTNFCGPVGVVLFNFGPVDFVVEAGDRAT